MSGENAKGLTIVISPLQSLMKDQVDNLEKAEITDAVTINGLLDPIERAKSFERVEDGSASILYISPESLRSRTIERLILGRNVVRFVIDEAHCFLRGDKISASIIYISAILSDRFRKRRIWPSQFLFPVLQLRRNKRSSRTSEVIFGKNFRSNSRCSLRKPPGRICTSRCWPRRMRCRNIRL